MQKALSRIISTLKDPRIVEMVTVTSVEVANDLSVAKAFVSIYGEQAATTLEGLAASNGYIRKELAKHLRDMRTIPQVKFVLDTSLDYASKIDSIIREIHATDQANEDVQQGNHVPKDTSRPRSKTSQSKPKPKPKSIARDTGDTVATISKNVGKQSTTESNQGQ
jgi:ribosome-binding factor A